MDEIQGRHEHAVGYEFMRWFNNVNGSSLSTTSGRTKLQT